MAGFDTSDEDHPPTSGLSRPAPYLCLHHISVFVRDHDRSLRFYVDQLGLSLAHDVHLKEHTRLVTLALPDGTAFLVLFAPKPDSKEYKFVGQSPAVVLVTDDVNAQFQLWSERGVRFHQQPVATVWGGTAAMFEDPDGNPLSLVSWDALTSEVEAKRYAAKQKREAERRAAQELDIAKQVQRRLFPQTLPPVSSLEYAGICIQAREVGGDYYDFVDLGQQRLGLVVGDISGKGIAAALLMANLQANLRSRFIIAVAQPVRFLQSVNRLFYESTTDSAYATLFYAEYDGTTHRLRYANCGHLAGLLLRSDHTVEWLDSTGTVLGLFKEWTCTIDERSLFSGDTLVLYTDGITESSNDDGEQFGEDRLLAALRKHADLSTQALIEALIQEVQTFNPGEQRDDLTIIVARCIANI